MTSTASEKAEIGEGEIRRYMFGNKHKKQQKVIRRSSEDQKGGKWMKIMKGIKIKTLGLFNAL